MKAYVYSGRGKLLTLDVEKPQMPKGGALARICYASICGTDLRTYVHGNDNLVPPRIIGHEALYELVAVSSEISDEYKSGDRVIVAPAIGCGRCPSCKKGKTNMCNDLRTIGFEYDGTFAEFCAIPAQAFVMGNVIKVTNPNVEAVACVAEPIACAINGQEFLNIQPGENILIFGAGYLGCIHSELALIKGAGKVILGEVAESRRKLAQKAIPVIETVNPSDETFAREVDEITSGAGVEVVITACPVGKTHSQALEIINKSGRVSLFGGLPGEGKGFLDSNLIHYKELGIFGAHASTPDQNKKALNYIVSGRLKVDKYLSVFHLMKLKMLFSH